MKTQALINQVSDRNSPLKKLADKIVSNIKGDPATSRLGVTIDWSKGTMLIDSSRK